MVVQSHVEATTQSKQPPKVGRHPPVEKHWPSGLLVLFAQPQLTLLCPSNHPPATCSSACCRTALSMSSTCSSAPSMAFSKAFVLMWRPAATCPDSPSSCFSFALVGGETRRDDEVPDVRLCNRVAAMAAAAFSGCDWLLSSSSLPSCFSISGGGREKWSARRREGERIKMIKGRAHKYTHCLLSVESLSFSPSLFLFPSTHRLCSLS